MTTQAIQSKADKIIADVKELVNEPLVIDMTGTIHIEESPNGDIFIRLTRNVGPNMTLVQPQVQTFSAPEPKAEKAVRVRRTTRKNIINTANIPDFKGFTLKNGFKTKRAALVMQAYGTVPEGVPGREIIGWAKANPQFASEVEVEMANGKVLLTDLVNNFN